MVPRSLAADGAPKNILSAALTFPAKNGLVLGTVYKMITLPTILLRPGEADRVLAGHPWIYAGSVLRLTAPAADGELAKKLLSAVGIAFQVKEDLLDAVTGLSGSGPAYVFSFIEGLIDGGVAVGLSRDMATKLAAQTVLGAAKMILETGQQPSVLREQVTSPGGTTIEGLKELEKGKLHGVLMDAVHAATEKSKRLGQS